jgi:hypothetical protein
VLENDPANHQEFKKPCFQVADCINECGEDQRYKVCEERDPQFEVSLFGKDWQGQVSCTSSSNVSDFVLIKTIFHIPAITVTDNGTSMSAYGAQVAPSERRLEDPM